MLNACQSWCERSRVESDTRKTKIMTINTHLDPDQRPAHNTWSIITFQFLPPDHQHKTLPLKVVDSFKYLGIPIDKDLSMSTLHTLILDNIQKVNGKLNGLLRDHLPKNNRLPPESCVLVQAPQYLQYIHSPTQLENIQSGLNKSMKSVFGCSGLPSILQADLGIPPLVYYQMKQLATSHFRLTNTHYDSIPGQLYAFRTHNLRNLYQTDLESRFILDCRTIFPEWSPADPIPQPKYLERVMIQNREKSFGRFLHAPISTIWRMHLRSLVHTLHLPNPTLTAQTSLNQLPIY